MSRWGGEEGVHWHTSVLVTASTSVSGYTFLIPLAPSTTWWSPEEGGMLPVWECSGALRPLGKGVGPPLNERIFVVV